MTDSVGAELARAREERGLSISDVAQQLKFAPRQLEALEQERFELLPGATFVRGMLRSYARLLRLDPEPLIERIAGRLAAPDAGTLAARYNQPVPFADHGRRSTFVYLALSLGVLMIGGGVAYSWYREHHQTAQLAAAKRAAPAPRPAAPAPKPAGHAPRAEPKVVQVAAAPKPALEAPSKIAQTKPDAPAEVAEPKRAAEVVPASAQPDPAKAVKPLTGALNRLVIRCDDEAWIEVKDANDRMLVSSLNPKGAERIVRARGPLNLVIGNPGQVRVLHNDRVVDLVPHTKAGVARFTLP